MSPNSLTKILNWFWKKKMIELTLGNQSPFDSCNTYKPTLHFKKKPKIIKFFIMWQYLMVCFLYTCTSLFSLYINLIHVLLPIVNINHIMWYTGNVRPVFLCTRDKKKSWGILFLSCLSFCDSVILSLLNSACKSEIL